MSAPSPADDHRASAAVFAERVRGAGDWDAPTPVPAWQARDVVRHLVEWFPGFLAGGSDRRLPEVTSVDDDPVAAWEQHTAGVQAILDDPDAANENFAHPHLPAMPLTEAISQFYVADVFMHTWDLARSTGQEDRLDEDRCRAMLEGMEPMDEMLRSSGQYGPRIPVAEDATWCDRLMGFIGRDPSWRPR
ncbi:TIGR03086 family metal-binding protein [Nocardioides caeni]|uniref:TIGR03086 family protein n=1 Tax=Nocardioides caeni TaxID=574700 RepID=A0A4V4HKW5_9ACTN|nr:TIGR03086 family metal-binding protein [Nocardioides caeni]THV15896.1 TIGR03086 family protein [Nocardioides caeni]